MTHMIYQTPPLDSALLDQIRGLDAVRASLSRGLGGAGGWGGTLRRLVKANAAQASTSIEGFSVPEETALALLEGEQPPDPNEEAQLAVVCYGRAMDHVAAMADDPTFRWHERVILDLHFDACSFQTESRPGRWRTGPVGVTGAGGQLIYQAPPPEQVPSLMAEVVDWLETGDRDAPAVVRAAMAHLHLVSVHPFRDGNGRIARIVQSLVLAREAPLSPEFSSIEEYLGHHTRDYYRVLHEVQGSRYQPARSAEAWVRFCVQAHAHQARVRLSQVERASERWYGLEALVGERGWPDRLVIALEQSLIGGTDRSRYATEAEVSLATATGDLRRLLDAGLIEQQGRGRSTRYHASDALRARVGTARDRAPESLENPQLT